MNIDVYEQIYAALDGVDDVPVLSEHFLEPVGVIDSILNQKVVENVKRSFPRVKNMGRSLLKMWKKGMTISDIARKNNIPATLMVTILLKEMEIPKKSFLKNIDEYPDRRLRTEVNAAMDSDYFFSPRAHDLHFTKGKMGEKILETWLLDKDVSFMTEDDLRGAGETKTPDFLLVEPLDIDGTKVSWIESKALFGDTKEHQYYVKKQFNDYEENYGTGMVVYWYGFIDSISLNGHLIKDYNFFGKDWDMVDELLNYVVCW
ncbi:C15orf41 family protein [Methanolobus sp. ZRKC3]|uniref:C15orf41 family protein n=1 Tax=Methanolobus sp. ZRKC3 TaxID=3125786 RepID=UPI00324EB8D4